MNQTKLLTNFKIEMLKKERALFTFVNPYSYGLLASSHDVEISSFKLFADGILLVKLHNLFKTNKISRFSFDFTSLAPTVFNFCSRQKMRVAIIGGTSAESSKAVRLLKKKYPELIICYCNHGYVADSQDEIIETLNSAQAEVIIAGMGTPLQEKFLLLCEKRVKTLRLAFTCGGFISQIAANPEYFHPLMNRFHLRWLQRFIRHSYVRKRMLRDYPIFVFKYIFSKDFRNFY